MSEQIKRDDGGPAFPRAGYEGMDFHDTGYDGMTLRDYFAGQAMAANISNEMLRLSLAEVGREKFQVKLVEAVAIAAFEYADAMLAERRK